MTQALWALSNLAVNADNRVIITRAGGVKPLVQLLCTADTEGKTTRLTIRQALSNLGVKADTCY